MKFIRIILFPLVPVYYLVTWLRNYFYDLGVLRSESFELRIICVGNLSTGGTGKTPMIEFLVRLLMDKKRVATLSRGYKRKTEGFVLADASASANSIGDEPYQFHNKFENLIVAVDADRKNGIKKLQELKHVPEVILLDDAYQHRRVKAGLTLLLTSYDKPYFKDIVLPTGNLREPRSGSKRADIIVVTKCPRHLADEKKNEITSKLCVKSHQSVFFSHIHYDDTVYSKKNKLKVASLPSFTLVTGIANAKPLVAYLSEIGLSFDHIEYPDHYNFKPTDIKMLSEKELVITTEKDFVRLSEAKPLKEKLFYLPIRLELDRGDDFEKLILSYVN
ncbi:tetraacyldisaccharide 4'-kinase [Winogradskyella aurantia]|uniref:Tetraacyldisaccharide 4'-kinase n=1 Tax=Winogradskyella aurantia TaxID=1915063 RepID=A0A265UV20_9FLAO|nr:tetraacyldisaccharide 4'-kinase [Winogradskyella aurantia]OZV69163.1 tetraacyldisaccharide 4'-kinase [Winogradskyella aurantia]